MRNASRNANELIRVLGLTKDNQEHPSNVVFKTGTIPAGYSGTGWPTIQFDGESTVGARTYPYVSSYAPVPGDRVILAMLANSGVILGKIGEGSSTVYGGAFTILPNNAHVPADLPAAYPDGISMFWIQGNPGGWPVTTGYGFVTTYSLGGMGYQDVIEMYVGTDPSWKDNRKWMRNKRDSNNFWQPFQEVLTDSTAANIAITNWQSPTYQNGWSAWADVNYGVPFVFTKDAVGIVHMRGLVGSPASGAAVAQPIFYLPTGYRPGKNLIFACTSNDAYMGMEVVSSTGAVQCRNAPSASSWFSLDPISFLAEQ